MLVSTVTAMISGRAAVVSADYAGFSSVGSINIYRYYACVLLAEDEGVPFAERQSRCDAELAALGSQAERARRCTTLALI